MVRASSRRAGRALPPSLKVLNIGSGPKGPDKLHAAFRNPIWQEVRLDIDPAVRPDIVGSIVSMPEIASGSFDAIWSSHNVEHLHAHEVAPALRECLRVLKPTGIMLVTCPDLEKVASQILSAGPEAPAYVSPAGPITPIDMLFGHGASIEAGKPFMAHRTGFTAKRLADALLRAGFPEVRVAKGANFDIWALALTRGADRSALEPLLRGTEQENLLHPARAEEFV